MPPLLAAKIRPLRRGRLYARVVVHRNLKALRAECQKDGRHVYGLEGLLAYTQGAWSADGLFCELHFSRTRLGTNTLTHECYHATQRWLQTRGWVNRNDVTNLENGKRSTEEWAAVVHGNLCAALVDLLYAEKLIK